MQQVSEFDLFTLDDIDSAFQNVTRLTYSQNHYMSGRLLFFLSMLPTFIDINSCTFCIVVYFIKYNLVSTIMPSKRKVAHDIDE